MDEPSRHVPVRPLVLAVLMALGEGPAPGVDILERANQAGARTLLGPGSLYRILRELRHDGLVRRAPSVGGDDNDERRSYHALTELGRAVLEAEAARLMSALTRAGLAGGGDGS